MKHLIIIGAGAFGREMFWHIQNSKGYGVDYDVKGYIADDYNPDTNGDLNLQRPLLSSIDGYKIEKDDVFICAIGSTNARENTITRILSRGGEFISVIHNTSLIHGTAKIGVGVFIGPYTVIGDSVKLKDHVMLNTHSSIGHDAIIEEYTCIMSYVDITGYCHIGKKVFLASGCRMTPSSIIGDEAYVGIGSVILRHVKSKTKVFGNPARAVDI